MVDVNSLQNLTRFQKIANPDGTPTELFMRILQGSNGSLGDKANASLVLSAGAGLLGGGDLTEDRAFAIDMPAEAERIRDVIGAALVAGTNITIVINDAGDTITINASGGGGGAPWYFNPPLASTFTTFVSSDGGANLILTDDTDVGLIIGPNSYSGGFDRGRRAVLAPPLGSGWKMTAHSPPGFVLKNTDYNSVGLVVADGPANKLINFSFSKKDGGGFGYVVIEQWTGNGATFNSTKLSLFSASGWTDWLRIIYDSGAGLLRFLVSTNGKAWSEVYNQGVTSFFTSVPNQVGLLHAGNNATFTMNYMNNVIDYWNLVAYP